MELTEEQRKSLEAAEGWLDDMSDFLETVPHGRNDKVVSADNARSVMKMVRILASGSGVTYRCVR